MKRFVITRRALMRGAAGTAVAAFAHAARADAAVRMPVAYVSHGSPLLAVDPVRGPALRAWGAALPKPSGIVVMTPHYGSRRVELGATGRGVAGYTFPRGLAKAVPPDLSYASPPSEELAVRVERLVGELHPVARSDRTYFDHTTWMPLMHLRPAADVPVLEVAYPYMPEKELLAIGRRLAPLRDEGVLFLASGGMTHNLAAMRFEANAPVPAWSKEFDDWASRALGARDVDALVDWRKKAPAADLAHPDDGAHYRVLLVALGAVMAAEGAGSGGAVSFPFAGFEGGLSVRCAQIA